MIEANISILDLDVISGQSLVIFFTMKLMAARFQENLRSSIFLYLRY
jgi:hypothetical protein